MFCKNCGTQLEDGKMFCPNCGAKVEEERNDDAFETRPQSQAPVRSEMPWKIFAIIGFSTSIIWLVLIWIPFLGFCSIESLVFSILGKKSQSQRGKAVGGIVMSIITIVANLLLSIILLALGVAFMGLEGALE